jgi:hypothetical protein
MTVAHGVHEQQGAQQQQQQQPLQQQHEVVEEAQPYSTQAPEHQVEQSNMLEKQQSPEQHQPLQEEEAREQSAQGPLQQQEPPPTSLGEAQQQQQQPPELPLDSARPQAHQLQGSAQASPQPPMAGAGCIPAPALAGASTGRPAGQAAKHLLMLQAAVSRGSANGKQCQQQAQVTAAEPPQEAAAKDVQAQVVEETQDAGRRLTLDMAEPGMPQPGAQELTASVTAGPSSPGPSTAPLHDPEHPALTRGASPLAPGIQGAPGASVQGAREAVAAAPAGPHAAGSQQEYEQQPVGAATSPVPAAAAVQAPVAALAVVPEPSPVAAPRAREPAHPVPPTVTAVHPPAQPEQPSEQQQQQVGPLHEPQQEQSHGAGPQPEGSHHSRGQQQGASGVVSSGAVSPGSEDAHAQVLR